MGVDLGTIAIVAQVAATLGLAAFVLVIDFSQRVHRAFALLMVARAMLAILFLLGSDIGGLAGRLRFYWFIALPFIALHFGMVYRRRHAAQRRPIQSWAAPLLITVVAAAFEVSYALRHELFFTPPRTFGPFVLFVYLALPSYAAVALLFAFDHERGRPTGDQNAFLLATVGFSLEPLFYAVFRLSDLAIQAVNGTVRTVSLSAETLGLGATAVLLVATLALVARSRIKARSRVVQRILALWAIVVATAVVCAAFETTAPGINGTLLVVLTAVWAVGLPILVTYALVKHRLFDAEVKLRFAIKGTTLAAIFLAAFFVVNKIVENVVAEKFQGPNHTFAIYAGGAVAGLLLFALAPLQRVADRLAHRAVPSGRTAHGTHEERRQLYREQLEIAWADGRLTTKERLLFARLQERLGIPADEAQALETEVLAGMPVAKPKRRRATPA